MQSAQEWGTHLSGMGKLSSKAWATRPGTKAQIYVNGADQPCLIVNDLKLGDTRGKIALWAHPTTDAYFSNLTVSSAN